MTTPVDATTTLSLQERIALAKERRRLTLATTSSIQTHSEPLDPRLQAASKLLPSNYDFQLQKSIKRINDVHVKTLALQLPEGLLMYACILSDIFKQMCRAVDDIIIFGDVTYGACCVDDFAAKQLNCDLMIHYGHSCLVPITVTKQNTEIMYVFVDIKFNVHHMVESLKLTFGSHVLTKVFLMGTIQFSSCLSEAASLLESTGRFKVEVPQAKPLSRGEVLGCTAPTLSYTRGVRKQFPSIGSDCCGNKEDNCKCRNIEKAESLEVVKSNSVSKEVMVFVADGRFHMESALIANPDLESYRYNPYDKKLTLESYDVKLMKANRLGQIHIVCEAMDKRKITWCVIMGTLGRQGNPLIVERITKLLAQRQQTFFVMLLSEAHPTKLAQVCGHEESEIDVFVQVCCPRLSIDWGLEYPKPLLTPYEFFVVMKQTEFLEIYPQDFYAKTDKPWTNYFSSSAT